MREADRQSVKGECREWGHARGKKRQCCLREGGAALGHVRWASEALASGRRGTGTDCSGEFSVLTQAREDNSGGNSSVIFVRVCCVLCGASRGSTTFPCTCCGG